MRFLVVGSLGIDTIETPFGRVENVLGGSATYISTAASYFVTPIRLVGVVGGDFTENHIDFLESRERGCKEELLHRRRPVRDSPCRMPPSRSSPHTLSRIQSLQTMKRLLVAICLGVAVGAAAPQAGSA